LLRWGNYDTVNAASRWQSSEVPSGLAQYANSVPGSQSLPASFYLSSKPSWFGSVAWPAIGPDVTGGNVNNLAGHVYQNPAQLCYEKLQKVREILTFNAANRYKTGSPFSPPAPPTNLQSAVN